MAAETRYEHEELDRDIERRMEAVNQLRRTLGSSPLITRLQAKGLI